MTARLILWRFILFYSLFHSLFSFFFFFIFFHASVRSCHSACTESLMDQSIYLTFSHMYKSTFLSVYDKRTLNSKTFALFIRLGQLTLKKCPCAFPAFCSHTLNWMVTLCVKSNYSYPWWEYKNASHLAKWKISSWKHLQTSECCSSFCKKCVQDSGGLQSLLLKLCRPPIAFPMSVF